MPNIVNKVSGCQTAPIESFNNFQGGLKKLDKKNLKRLKESIVKKGFTAPLFIWKGNILDGHQRKVALESLKDDGYTIPEVPFVEIEAENEKDAKEILLTYVSQYADVTNTGLEAFIKEAGLNALELDAFTNLDLGTLIANDAKEDDYEPANVEPRAKLGDIYQLGEHRLMCGDSTSKEDVAKLMNGKRAELLFTSPPYADMREYGGGKDLSIENLASFIETFDPYCSYQAVNLGIKRENHEIIPYWDIYINIAKSVGLKLMAWNVWAKQNAGSVGQQSAFIPIAHEWIFVFGREFKDINRTEKRKTEIKQGKNERSVRQADGSMKYSSFGEQKNLKEMESVFFCTAEMGAVRKDHPATFPIALPDKYIQAITNEGNIVAEPFNGSGTTIMACEQNGRTCYAIDISPAYIDVAIARWEKFTNRKAVKLN